VLRVALHGQAAYYVLAGLWPLISLDAFERVTGPKTDEWLVYMVGLLAVAVGLTLGVGARPARPAGAIVVLAAGSASSFAWIDLRYALSGRIEPIYLLDAGVEVGLLLALLVGWLQVRRTGDRPSATSGAGARGTAESRMPPSGAR
jgi:hypothetical protein